MLDVVETPAGALHAVPEEESFQGCAVAETEWNGMAVHVLDPARVLLEVERQRLAGLQSRARQYLEETEQATG